MEIGQLPPPRPPRPPRPFVKGPGPLVSVLVPSRGRPQDLLESMNSLWKSAACKDQLEFLVKVDDDDEETLACLRSMTMRPCVRAFSSPRGGGYNDLHLWHRQLAAKATGDWLLIWNDDAYMTTSHWDVFVAEADANYLWHGCDDVCLLTFSTTDNLVSTEFSMIRKASADLLGHLALSPHTDNWLYTIFNLVGSALRLPVTVEHRNRTESGDFRYPATQVDDWNTVAGIWGRIRDAGRLLEHLDRKGAG